LAPALRLTLLLPLGAMVFTSAIFLLDRRLVKEFLEFARTAFKGNRNTPETP
jgi:hypothetical protein